MTHTITPIAYLRSEAKSRYEAPRQPAFAHKGAFVEFTDDPRLPLAAEDLKGFDKIWLIGLFHLNQNQDWKAKVRPPLTPDGKRYGVLSTRSPHRPNFLSLSCVTLIEVTPKGLLIGPSDLLDGTPIFDIKPYIPAADAFPEAKAGWRDLVNAQTPYTVLFDPQTDPPLAQAQTQDHLDLKEFATLQLAYNPLDKRRKRISHLPNGQYEIACQLWRLTFTIDDKTQTILVTQIHHI